MCIRDSCFVFDNLSGCMIGGGTDYELNEEPANALRHLCFMMSRYFVAPIYTCSASSSRWDVGPSFDNIAAQWRSIAVAYGVVPRTGEHFWDTLHPICLYYKTGARRLWHHGEAGGQARLAYFHNRELFNLSLIHI